MKFVCIMPAYYTGDDTHFRYTYELLETVTANNQATLFIEDADSDHYKSSVFDQAAIQRVNTKPLNLLERLWILFKLCRDENRVFYIHYSYYSLFILVLLKPFFNLKLYYWHAEMFTKSEFAQLSLFERVQLRLAIRLAPNLITASPKLATAYSQLFGKDTKQIKIVPNWVKKPEKAKLTQKKSKTILFVHRLSPRKGADLLPKIWNRVSKVYPEARLLIVGSGPLLETLKDRMKFKRVSFVGSVSQKKVSRYYQKADVFIMPSRREGVPRVLLEAMIHKVPIVATDVGAVSDIVSENQASHLIESEDIDSFAHEIVSQLQTPDKNLVEANYRKVTEQSSLKQASEALENILLHNSK